ncbi:MAG: trypsin-like serine peptidase [Geitlerinemataceae cyanobacterium]
MINVRNFSRRFRRGFAIFCLSLLAVVASDTIAIAQNLSPTLAPTLAQTLSPDDFEIPAVSLTLDPESDSAGAVPDGLGVSLSPVADGERGVIGGDDRTAMTSAEYPWSAIGRLERRRADGSVQGWCTASLIAPDVILTNAHCIVDKETHQLRTQDYVFRPNMIRGESVDATPATVLDYGRGWSRGAVDEDWAIMELDEALGFFYGELGWYDADLARSDVREALDTRVFLAGYSQDFPDNVPGYEPGNTPGVHRNCSITNVRDDGRIIHNCDTRGGASGSPLIARLSSGEFTIVGLHAGGFRNSSSGEYSSNYAMQVNRWKEAAQEYQW